MKVLVHLWKTERVAYVFSKMATLHTVSPLVTTIRARFATQSSTLAVQSKLTVSIHPIVMNFAYKAQTLPRSGKSQLKYQSLTSMISQDMKQQLMKMAGITDAQVIKSHLIQNVNTILFNVLVNKMSES